MCSYSGGGGVCLSCQTKREVVLYYYTRKALLFLSITGGHVAEMKGLINSAASSSSSVFGFSNDPNPVVLQ